MRRFGEPALRKQTAGQFSRLCPQCDKICLNPPGKRQWRWPLKWLAASQLSNMGCPQRNRRKKVHHHNTSRRGQSCCPSLACCSPPLHQEGRSLSSLGPTQSSRTCSNLLVSNPKVFQTASSVLHQAGDRCGGWQHFGSVLNEALKTTSWEGTLRHRFKSQTSKMSSSSKAHLKDIGRYHNCVFNIQVSKPISFECCGIVPISIHFP